jgi:hypothetical protein
MEKKTKKAYEEHLNENSPPYESEQWIIGGILPRVYRYRVTVFYNKR